MSIRAILAALIAISVAVVPATGGVSVSSKPVEMSIPGGATMPCCPCCNDSDISKNSAECALKCINLVGAVLPDIAIIQPHLFDAALPTVVNDPLRGYISDVPTHPPPV